MKPRITLLTLGVADLSRSVGFLKTQSCKVSAPLPNGFSRLSPGPVMNPSRDMVAGDRTVPLRLPSGAAGTASR